MCHKMIKTSVEVILCQKKTQHKLLDTRLHLFKMYVMMLQ